MRALPSLVETSKKGKEGKSWRGPEEKKVSAQLGLCKKRCGRGWQACHPDWGLISPVDRGFTSIGTLLLFHLQFYLHRYLPTFKVLRCSILQLYTFSYTFLLLLHSRSTFLRLLHQRDTLLLFTFLSTSTAYLTTRPFH